MDKKHHKAIKFGGAAMTAKFWLVHSAKTLDEKYVDAMERALKAWESDCKLKPENCINKDKAAKARAAAEALKKAAEAAAKAAGKSAKATKTACELYAAVASEYLSGLDALDAPDPDEDLMTEEYRYELKREMPMAMRKLDELEAEVAGHVKSCESLKTKFDKIGKAAGTAADTLDEVRRAKVKAALDKASKQFDATHRFIMSDFGSTLGTAAQPVFEIRNKVRSRALDKDFAVFDSRYRAVNATEKKLKRLVVALEAKRDACREVIDGKEPDYHRKVDRIQQITNTYAAGPFSVESMLATISEMSESATMIVDVAVGESDEKALREARDSMRMVTSQVIEVDSNLTNMRAAIVELGTIAKAFPRDKSLTGKIAELRGSYDDIKTQAKATRDLVEKANKALLAKV